MSSLGEERAARNEALFREVNENIARLEQSFGGSAVQTAYICECSSGGCTHTVTVDDDTYRRVRENPRRFIVLPGHVDEAVEVVVETHSDYLVVEKTGVAGDIAEQAQD